MGSDKHPIRRHPIPSANPFPIPRESCCTFPRRGPPAGSQMPIRHLSLEPAPPSAHLPLPNTRRKLLNHYPRPNDASASCNSPACTRRVSSSSSSSSSTEILRQYLWRWMRRDGSGPLSPLSKGVRFHGEENRFTVELREIKGDYSNYLNWLLNWLLELRIFERVKLVNDYTQVLLLCRGN